MNVYSLRIIIKKKTITLYRNRFVIESIEDSHRYHFSTGFHIIGRLEIIDQRNGTGGFVAYMYGGVGQRSTTLYMERVNEDSVIDFVVNAYAEPLRPIDFIVGHLTGNSYLLFRFVVDWKMLRKMS